MIRFQDVVCCFETCLIVRFVLAVQHVLHKWHQLTDSLIVQHVQSLVLCERRIQQVHRHCRILYHCQRIQSCTHIILLNNIFHNGSILLQPRLHHIVKCLMPLHTFVYDFCITFKILLLLHFCVDVELINSPCSALKAAHVHAYWFVLWRLYKCRMPTHVHISIIVIRWSLILLIRVVLF